MAGMTESFEIRDFIVAPVTVNMIDFKILASPTKTAGIANEFSGTFMVCAS
tara:strand:+ start:233 stop:385 length:153 start_codon:yes stop_codon:yes gene_type:complete